MMNAMMSMSMCDDVNEYDEYDDVDECDDDYDVIIIMKTAR